MSPSVVSDRFLPFLTEPNFGFLGTVRPDGTAQVNPMWFEFDGENVRFTHTSKRQKYRNLQQNPSMSLAIARASDLYRYVELRGRLVEVLPDPEGAFYVHLAERYGQAHPQPPADHADRVILVMSVEHVSSN